MSLINTPRIRSAAEDDVDTIVEIAMRAWEPIWDERAGVLGEELMRADCGGDWKERKAENLRGHCEWDLSTVYVTELDGQVVGFITFAPFWDKGILEIANNAVDPGYQGRGIGAAQYEYVLAWGREKGLRYAKVTTGLDDCHAAARAAYERAGFDRSIPSVTYYRELQKPSHPSAPDQLAPVGRVAIPDKYNPDEGTASRLETGPGAARTCGRPRRSWIPQPEVQVPEARLLNQWNQWPAVQPTPGRRVPYGKPRIRRPLRCPHDR